jgi:hypothetical protein
MATYKSHSGQILLTKTMRENSGAVFNYMVAAFEETGQAAVRTELRQDVAWLEERHGGGLGRPNHRSARLPDQGE